jgi:hypothetical protein
MPRRITLKTAKKQPGTISRAKVRRVVAEVYATPLAELAASTPKKFDNIVITRKNKKSLTTK